MNSRNLLKGRQRADRFSTLQFITRGFTALSIAGVMTLAAITSGPGVSRAATASAGSSAATIAPADAIFYFGMSLDMESDQWLLANELLQRAGAGEDPASLIDDAASGAFGQNVDPISESTAFLGGEAAIVVTSLDAFSTEAAGLTDITGTLGLPPLAAPSSAGAGMAVIIKPSDLAAATAQIDAELIAEAADFGVDIQSSVYNGVTIQATPGDDLTGTSGIAYAVVDEFLVISETPADIESIIDTSKGDSPSLAGADGFSAADQALAGDRLGFGFVDGVVLAESARSLDTSGMGLVDAFGGLIGASSYTGLSIIADPVGFRFNTVEVPVDGTGTTAPERPAPDLSFAGKVPANSLIFANGVDLGQAALLQGIGFLFVSAMNSVLNPSAATPEALPSVDELYQQAAILIGFNLKTDFIDQLTGEYGIALWASDPADPSQVGAILSSGLESPATVADVLSKLSLLIQAGGQGEVNVTTRIVDGANVSVIDIPGDGGAPVTLEYGVVNNEFLLGIGDGIDSYLDGPEESLSSSAGYQEALAALPSEFDSVFFVNVPAAAALGESAMTSSLTSSFLDNSEACGEFSTQAAAQEAYDADSVSNFELDLDFDGEACEDFFSVATPEALPIELDQDSAVRAFATVGFTKDGLTFTNSILLVAADQANDVADSELGKAPDGVRTYSYPGAQHDDSFTEWTEVPPAGGLHNSIWQQCGYYSAPINSGMGVHSMEHGAVWITYSPDLPQDQIDQLKAIAEGEEYVLVSPYDGLPSAIVASAWNKQLNLESADDPSLRQFISVFKNSPEYTPEYGATCASGSTDTI